LTSYFKIPHYNIYFTNHPDNTTHTGSGILIKNTISHYELPKFGKNFLQATTAVATVYCPPGHNIKEENFFKFFHTLGNKFIAGGDYNCKNSLWECHLITTKGRELSKHTKLKVLLSDNGYSYILA
jgi:hypothetical protein